MPKRSAKHMAIDRCIVAFLKEYRKFSHIGDSLEGAYYWNEREAQWSLFNHMRSRTISRSIGSEWWIHAEGDVERPSYARWSGLKRADIVVVNHSKFRKWWKSGQRGPTPAYVAMIELKVLWSGSGMKSTLSSIKADVRKLAGCLDGGRTEEAHLILLDALGRRRVPYYTEDSISKMLQRVKIGHRMSHRLRLWHWPDSDQRVDVPKQASWKAYTAYV